VKARYLVAALALLAPAAFAPGAAAKGDLATGTVILPPLVLGSKESDYAMSVKRYELETGKAYRLKIEGGGFKQYHLVAPEFFRNIWVRKIEAGDVTVDAPVIDGLEFEEEGDAELSFVPIRPGTYEFKIEGLEQKGMVGQFVVK
jgi:uncharacterized cupredoxin-like copper-binding protein